MRGVSKGKGRTGRRTRRKRRKKKEKEGKRRKKKERVLHISSFQKRLHRKMSIVVKPSESLEGIAGSFRGGGGEVVERARKSRKSRNPRKTKMLAVMTKARMIVSRKMM